MDEDCEEAEIIAYWLFVVFSSGPYIILPCVIIVTMTFMYKVVKAREENVERFGATSLVVRNRISLLSPPDATEGGILHNDTEHKKILS